MPRWAKISLIILGVLLVIGFLVPYIADVNRYRPQIIAEVQARTGRKIEMGNIRARIIPSAGFSIENVTLGSPAGFANVNLLTAESIQGSVSLLALLRGAVEVTSVEIIKPQVALATDEHGLTNYDFSAPGAGDKTSRASSSLFSVFRLDAVSVKDADLRLVDVRGRKPQPPTVQATGVNADLSGIDLSPNGVSRWKGQVPLSGVKVRIAGLPPLAFRSGDLKLDQGAASGNCEVEVGDAGLVKGEFSVRDLQKAVAGSPHPTPRPVATGEMTAGKLRFAPYEVTAFSGDFKAFGDHVEMPIRMSAYGGALTVTARVDTGGATKKFSANVQLSQLDLEKAAAADPGTRGKITGRAEARMQIAGALGGNLMNSLTGQGNFALRDGRVSGLEVAKSIQGLTKFEHFFAPSRAGGAGGTLGTTFTLIDGDLNIHGGRIYTTKTHAETHDGTGDLHGSIGFDQTLDLAGTWKLARTGAQQGGSSGKNVLGGVFGKVAKHSVGELPFAFTVKGTLKNPKILPGEVPK
jgi:uncharacterized protein involved in outer membrane biogenesis